MSHLQIPVYRLFQPLFIQVYSSYRVFNEKLTLQALPLSSLTSVNSKPDLIFVHSSSHSKLNENIVILALVHMWRWIETEAGRANGKGAIVSESIQFNNKDVHLDKGINQAKNSMKCDAIHRTLSSQDVFFANSHRRRISFVLQCERMGVLFGVTQHNHRFRNRVFVYVAPSVMMSQPFPWSTHQETVLRRTTFFGYPDIRTNTHIKG